jgi:hypothetical protein
MAKQIRIKVPSWKSFRGFVLFVGGLAGVAYETLAEHADRPTLLVVFTAMMGLPLFLGADEKATIKLVRATNADSADDETMKENHPAAEGGG